MNVYIDHIEKFECPVCNGKIDCTDVPPFTEAACPGCGSKIRVPARFGHYILLERLGEGGTGPVYRARDTKLNRVVAIKILNKVLSLNPELVEFFKNQARSAANLSHRHVVRIFELGRHADQHYITMEPIEGQNLRDLLNEHRANEEEALQIGLGVSRGLQVAHEQGLVHGDVRPKNIFINSEGVPKIGDFGLSRSLSRGASIPPSRGSPYYTAPERLQGGEDTAQTDMYGLGATLYHALIGRPPFDDPDIQMVLRFKASCDVPDIREMLPDLPPETAAIVNRLLARDPAQRYPSFAELVQAFEDALKKYQPEPSALAAPAEGDAAAATVPAGGKRRLIGALLIGLALAAAAAVAWFVFQRDAADGAGAPPDPAPRVESP